MDSLVIPLSFKQTEKKLYNDIKSHSGYSYWLKEAAKEKLERERGMQNISVSNIPINNFPVFNENNFM